MTNFEEFEAAQDEYKRIVKKTCEALLCDINKTEHIVLHDKYDLLFYKTQKEMWEYSFAGNVYHFHGRGCTACMSDGTVVDWDFGGSHEWCMIEPYKMANTLEKNHYPNTQYYDFAFVRSLCEEFAAQGLLSGNDRIGGKTDGL